MAGYFYSDQRILRLFIRVFPRLETADPMLVLPVRVAVALFSVMTLCLLCLLVLTLLFSRS
ncbi:hypothetical protein DBL07_06470 [Achromobacter mucicolens]|nr:hypothetical protein A7J67_08970 [Achromobacter xylosoxidans]PTX06705.1 hypothetical protein DBL07_06470 [Achromobacter mucicolens]